MSLGQTISSPPSNTAPFPGRFDMNTFPTHTLTLPGAMLKRGFWLYVWRVETPSGEALYVGRTGDNSSPHATAPYTRMGQHLSHAKNQNALRRHLRESGIEAEDCEAFHLISCGPIYPEIDKDAGADRNEKMERHKPLRNIVGALEKALAEALTAAGYNVLNTVKWNYPLDTELWESVRVSFSEHFPKL